MNKYAQTPDEIIDLHGHTVREAEGVLFGGYYRARSPAIFALSQARH